MNYAAENGHFETVKWLFLNRSECSTTEAVIEATESAERSGHNEIVSWLKLVK